MRRLKSTKWEKVGVKDLLGWIGIYLVLAAILYPLSIYVKADSYESFCVAMNGEHDAGDIMVVLGVIGACHILLKRCVFE